MNTNCLKGMRCPNPTCNSEGPFSVVGTAAFVVYDEGTESHGDVEWHDEDICKCLSCDHMGTVLDYLGMTQGERRRYHDRLVQRAFDDIDFMHELVDSYMEKLTHEDYLDEFAEDDVIS